MGSILAQIEGKPPEVGNTFLGFLPSLSSEGKWGRRMGLAAVAAFWGVSILFVITPGADWAYAITAGMRQRTLPAVGGMLAGHVAATLVIAAGVGAMISGVPGALTVLTVAGALYLVWLGITTLRRPALVRAGDQQIATSSAGWWWKGFAVSGLNPKVFLLFLAILPQFTDSTADWPLAAQIVALGVVHVASCAIVYLAVGFGADAVLRSRPSAARIVSRVSGIAMIAIGAFLLFERMAP
jgi:threonine/homoserine/homoserine lactone efflux protein